ncbi:CDP-alcohol phosphatidyltransferase family protein [Phenylobacterium ferrooxidans]|uniref:CDP-alcohol phosphatidyltransferase family protein n=1 Tax=Phenylobacterium ferrooxidans TaxID=2982689 RepID=A0ABW6CMN7_9CAUL
MSAVNRSLWRAVVAEGEGLKLANLVTLSRGVLIVPTFALLIAGHPMAALIVYGVAASTDLLDGWLARRSGRSSAFGAQLDAAVDNLFSVAILGFLLLAYPGVAQRHAIALIVLFVGPVAYLAASWLLKRRFLMFHFWSAKAGAVLLFCLWPLMAITGSEAWLPAAAALVGLSRLEQIVFILRGGLDLNAPHGLAPIPRALELQP